MRSRKWCFLVSSMSLMVVGASGCSVMGGEGEAVLLVKNCWPGQVFNVVEFILQEGAGRLG